MIHQVYKDMLGVMKKEAGPFAPSIFQWAPRK
jgi:hypothetical protein